jgi:hypothetical protein
MATSRCKSAVVQLAAVACLACSPREETPPTASGMAVIQRTTIEHVSPKRDFVGAPPARLEWTAAAGAESYTVTVATEIDTMVFEHRGASGTAIAWPREIKLEPGTYFWRVVAIAGGRTIADSGRAAFVVMN